MHLTVQSSGIFIAQTVPTEKYAAAKAGFLYHGGKCKPYCPACKKGIPKYVWWSAKVECAARLYEYADFKAKTILAPHLKAVAESKATDAAIEIPANEGLNYLGYQKAGVAYALKRTGTLIADEMGLGKTIQALGLVNADPTIQSVLVVCPGSLRINWLLEAERWLVRPFSFHMVAAGTAPPLDVNFVIVNYDRLIGEGGEEVHQALMQRTWDLMVVDEAQYVKNPVSQRSISVYGRPEATTRKNPDTGVVEVVPPCEGLTDRAKRKVFLTGTPLPNRPAEVFPILRALDSKLFFDRKAFAKRYVKNSEKYLPELQEKLRATMMIRRVKSEVQKELPPKMRQVIVIPANGATDLVTKEKQAWEAFEDKIAGLKAEKALAHAAGDQAAYENALATLKDTIKAAFAEIAKIRHELAVAKVPYVQGHVDSLLESGVKKVVIFAHHKDVIGLLQNAYGPKCVILTGDTPMDKRQEVVQRFQTDPTCEVFIGGFKAAGVGITLTAACNVVFAEQDWTPSVLSQAEDRCHRIGQLWTVLAQHLVFDESLDARMAHYLIEKQALADLLLDASTSVEADLEAPVMEKSGVKTDATVAPLPKKYPVASETERVLAKQAMQLLAGLCDGAQKIDGAGFSKIDTKLGKSLAHQTYPFTDGQVFLAKRLAKIYRKQLPEALVSELGFNKPPTKKVKA